MRKLTKNELKSGEIITINFDEEINRREVPALKVHPKVLGDQSQHLFAAGVADMDFRISPAIRFALVKRLEHDIYGYERIQDTLLPSLTAWLYKRQGWSVENEHILRAPSILNAMAIAASIFTQPGDGVIVQPPVFFDFFDIIRENNRNIIKNPLKFKDGRYHMDYEDLERKVSEPNTKMIFLCSPHNPIGRVWTEAELRVMGDICAKNGVLVVSDEMHADLIYSGHQFTSFGALGEKYSKNSIVCISPAKSFNIAACCSSFTIISDDDKRENFQIENSRLTINKNNAFSNVAMEAAYTQGEPWLDAAMNYIERNHDLVVTRIRSMPNVGLIEPDGTFLLWVDFRELGFNAEELTHFLRQKAGWAVTRGEAFGEQGVGFARVNIACTYARLNSALDQLEAAILSL